MKTLANAINEMVQPFKIAWMKMMMDYADKHYEFIQKMYPDYDTELNRMKKVLRHFECRINGYWVKGEYVRPRRTETIFYKLSKAWRGEHYWNVTRETSFLRFNRAAKFVASNHKEYVTPKPEWMEDAKIRLEHEWINCVNKLIERCEKKDIDVDAIIVTRQPLVTSEGFEVAFTDGKDREIYARMIWAAEHSMFVSPHVRYIVTSKKLK